LAPSAATPGAPPVPTARIDASDYRRQHAQVEIVVPVYNEAATVVASVERLHHYLRERFPVPWLVTIVDNASTDDTWLLACGIARDLPGVQARRLARKGRGLALREAWSESPAPVVAYLDVDLSTDLDALLPLVAPLLSGHSGVAIGSRLAADAHVTRGPKRELISRTYNLILRTVLRSRFSDAQCGFKAVRTDVARELLPLVEDDAWFFDTELLVLAERNGVRVHEVPVDWDDDPDSRVDIVQTATDDLRGVVRLLGSGLRGEGRIPEVRRRQLGGVAASTADPLHRSLVAVGTLAVGIVAAVVAGTLLRPALGGDGAGLAAVAVGLTAGWVHLGRWRQTPARLRRGALR
jgi:hypothetical protein